MRTSLILENLVGQALRSAQAAGALPAAGEATVTIEKPKLEEHGDFATSLPLTLARTMRMAPMAIAEKIVENMPASEVIGSAEAAAPGFVNFRLADEWLRLQVATIEAAPETYGNAEEPSGRSIQVEFVSVNPTGPLHVGHARGAVLGSGLANVLEAAGHKVQREYYVNDGGNQMQVFNDTLYARFMQAAGHHVPLPDPAYPGEYLEELARDLLGEFGAELASKSRGDVISALAPGALERTLAGIKDTLARLDITYDEWFSEKSLLESGQFENALGILEKNGYLVERDGARWFLSTKFGEDDDDVVVRSGEGGPTYFGTDIAYHYNKFFVRKFDKVIDIWGADHHGHVSRMKSVIEAFGGNPDHLTIILNQIVNFKNEGETVRFSKRQGVIVTVDELIDEVGPDACRYIFLSRAPGSQMDFDLGLAKQQSSENPVYYVQYAHARLASIMRSAEEKGLGFSGGDLSLLTHDRELELIRRLIELPDAVHRAADRLEPHHLAHFAYEVARSLQRFYEECRVISDATEDAEITKARLRLVSAARIALARTLRLMGMAAPDRM